MERRGRSQTSALFLSSALLCALALISGCGGGGRGVGGDYGEAAEGSIGRSVAFLAGREAPVYGYEVIETYKHDSENFTQGLVFEGGVLYEGTGLQGRSRLIKSNLDDGKVLAERRLAPEYFGEGVTVLGDEVFQLTYTTGLGFVYDKHSLELRRTFAYPTEGWGLTHDGRSLIMSDGTSTLHFLDPVSGAETGSVQVADNLGMVSGLNELEYINEKVYANVWQTDVIAIISPRTGEVTGWIDLAGLNPDPARAEEGDVLNGIAYLSETGHLLVTGKRWPCLYEIDLLRDRSPQ